jgi:hypothetical protein
LARFDLVRKAGTLHFEGQLQGGGGSGTFTFSPSPDLADQLRSLGADNLSKDRLLTMSIFATAE